MQEIEIKNSGLGATVPEGWKELRLQDATNHFKSGLGITSEFISEEGEYSVYGGNGLRGFTDNFTHDGEYILIGRQGALCGNIQIVSGKNYISEHAIAVTTNEANDLKFLAYKLEFRNLNRLSESSAQPGLSVEKLVRIKLDFPPLPEQRAIADCLSTWDRAIGTTEQLIAQKELQKKWLMQQLLTGKKRLKGFSEEWRFIRFKEIYSQVKEKVGARSFLTLSVTKGGIVSQEEYFKKEISSDDTSNYLVVVKGNMVMSGLNFWMGSIDVLTHFDSGKVSPAYKVFEIINDTISPELMKIFVRSQLMLEALIGSSVIGASIVRRNMDRETLDEWSFKIPSLEEQQAIASILSESDRELDLLRERLAKLREQKKGLMQGLLTGKRRLKINF